LEKQANKCRIYLDRLLAFKFTQGELNELHTDIKYLAYTIQTVLNLAEEKEIANRKAERLRKQAEEMPCYFDAQEGQL